MNKFVRRVDLPEHFAHSDDRRSLYAFVADTLAVYYWCEMFSLKGTKPKRFCLLGPRGIVEYAAKKVQQIYNLIQITAAERKETVGWQYGAVASLRDALNDRRIRERADSAYSDQMMASVYRTQHDLKTAYKVGVSDARAVFDIDGFDRGKVHPWKLEKLLNPLEAMHAVRTDPKRYGVTDVRKD